MNSGSHSCVCHSWCVSRGDHTELLRRHLYKCDHFGICNATCNRIFGVTNYIGCEGRFNFRILPGDNIIIMLINIIIPLEDTTY